MKLKEILKNVDCEIYGDDNIDVSNLSHNSKQMDAGGVFFALKGLNYDGANFTQEAIKNGAKVIISEEKLNLKKMINVVVKDVRKVMSECAANFYSNPAEKMFIVGVTGTNGKTTSTYMMKNIFEKAGKKVGVIGTNGIMIGDEKFDSNFTTPDPIDLQKMLAKMRDCGVSVVCMEVSAHALDLQKLWGVTTDIAVFTNLTQDHLDYFETMENYFNAKYKFFTKDYSRFGVVNIDDEYGKLIFESSEIPMIAISRAKKNVDFSKADIISINEKHNINNQTFIVKTPKGEFDISLNLLGGFNVSNALGAIAVGIMAGVDKKHIVEALEKLERVDGRFNSFIIDGKKVIVDYAHTPDGLENILKSAKEITEGRLISVFGCGGNRDKSKRAIMGNISSKLADFSIITSDNPRLENPSDIINDITQGIVSDNYIIIEDRILAIQKAINLAECGDTIVVAGKGAEKYFDKDNQKIPYIGDNGVIEELQKKREREIQKEIEEHSIFL